MTNASDHPRSRSERGSIPSRRTRTLGLLIAAFLAACATDLGVKPGMAPSKPTRLEVIMINGGGRRAANYQSHMLHVKKLYSLLRRSGVRRGNITVFSADGSDPTPDLAVRDLQTEPDFWLIKGTRLEPQLRPQLKYENSTLKGAELHPATKEALRDWFDRAARRLGKDDTLLLYVTDHGTKNRQDPSNNHITLWGKDEAISVNELKAMIEILDPEVRVVALMSQCYSGAFGNLMYVGSENDLPPRGNVCGYFSSTADRPAYGCYPENRDKDNVGHSFRFIDSLQMNPSLSDAHQRVLVADRTPDVPLKSSDLYLASLLERTAKERGQETDELVDELLREAWRDKAAWEPEIRLLDRIGQAFGYFSPRSLSELKQQSDLLPDVSQKFNQYSRAWGAALQSLCSENLERFVDTNPSWESRLSNAAVASLDEDGRRGLTHSLLGELESYTGQDDATVDRLELLRTKADATKDARYRMQVRLGVVLRMEAVLTSIAGRVYLADQASADERSAHRRLTECETLSLPRRVGGKTSAVVREPFPSYEDELKLADEALPGWMGIRFRQASEQRRERYGLEKGAVAVLTVYSDSAAEAAGIEVGDLILGPPSQPFTESHQVREWVMTAPIGKPQPLLVNRAGENIRLTLTPEPYPIKWPELPGPPKVGSLAPPIDKLDTYRGKVPKKLASGKPHLLYFWATWCAPCKAALPELVAFERERETSVIAITDELREQLDTFFSQYKGDFPDAVAIDEFRRSFLAFGVSGTPSFVLVDGNGKVQSTTTGYNAVQGLKIDGWEWAGRPKKPSGG